MLEDFTENDNHGKVELEEKNAFPKLSELALAKSELMFQRAESDVVEPNNMHSSDCAINANKDKSSASSLVLPPFEESSTSLCLQSESSSEFMQSEINDILQNFVAIPDRNSHTEEAYDESMFNNHNGLDYKYANFTPQDDLKEYNPTDYLSGE